MAEVTIFGALRNAATQEKALTPVSGQRGGWWRMIHEPFSGAWQRNKEIKVRDLTCYPALYGCLNRVSSDVGKLPFILKREDANGIWRTVENAAYSPVLRKPNHYQTQHQFRESWILSKLIHGNAYILKGRDNRGVVTRLYVLDPCRVIPLVSETGDVFYQVNYPSAENLLPSDYPDGMLTIPASEIIHDRMNTFHHPLIGVPPLCAAYWPVVKNLNILKNESEFFANGARPGGILMAPAGITEEDARNIMDGWHRNYGGENAGKLAVIGGDLKYQDIGSTSGADSQLVEQMRYGDEQICQAFGVPPFIIGLGSIPAGLKADDMANVYYKFALQAHIESMEYLLDEGLGITKSTDGERLGVELDLEPLLRMDFEKQAEFETKLVAGMVKTPNEARFKFGLGPTGGGDTLWGQKQDFPLQVLADNHPDMQSASQHEVQAAPPADGDDDDEAQEQVERGLRAITALNTIKAIEAVRSEVFR